jgi:hypothetical protein
MSEYPKDGSTFVTETIERTAYRWAKYKPDGARQMGKPGRWQKQVWSGDYFKWENCADPEGELSQPIEDGPISSALKAVPALQAEIATLREENTILRTALRGVEALPRHSMLDVSENVELMQGIAKSALEPRT